MIPHDLAGWSEMLRGFAPAVENHLWQSTAFAVVAGLLTLALRKNHARARYWIWMAASLKFVVAFALLASLGSHVLKPHPLAASQAPIYVAVEDVSEPFALPARGASTLVSPARPGEHGFAAVLPVVVGAVWLGGFAAVLLLWGVRYRRVALAMRAAVPVRGGREFELLRRIESESGLRTRVELRLSDAAMEPGIFGLGTSSSLLSWPVGLSERLHDAHLEAVLVHEVAHVRRRDNLTAAIHMLVEAAFWFHPLVWWLGARLVAERERACDEEVLLVCGRPEIYAQSILKVCEFCVESPLACVSGVTGADLKQRVVQIMTERVVRKLELGKKLLLFAVALCVVAVPIVLGQAKAAQRLIIPASADRDRANQDAPKVPDLTFDVASIRETQPIGPHEVNDSLSPHSSKFVGTNLTVGRLVGLAYGLNYSQISGGPEWFDSATFNVEAKSDSATDAQLATMNDEQATLEKRHMLQALLTDRFRLKVRVDAKESTIYALVVAKNGPKLHDTKPDPVGVDGPHGDPVPVMNQGVDPDGLQLIAHGITMKALAGWLAVVQHTPVVDKTGLNGKYDFTLHYFAMKSGALSDDPSKSPPPAVAIQDQLGLKLEKTKGPVEMLVVDHIERPSEN